MTQFILDALFQCNSEKEVEQLADLFKETKVPLDIVKDKIEQCKEAGFDIGSKVIMASDPKKEIGKVLRFNETSAGFYTGSRYPLVVEFKRGTFQYALEEMILVERENGR